MNSNTSINLAMGVAVVLATGVTVVALILLTGCGGGSGSASPNAGGSPNVQNVEGLVSDPQIMGANVRLVDTGDQTVGQGVSSDDGGAFTITGSPAGSLADYRVLAKGGIDTGTGEDISGIELSLPLGLYETGQYSAVVVSPVTSLIDAAQQAGGTLSDAKTTVAARLGLDPGVLTDNPTDSTEMARVSMKLMLLRRAGQPFSAVYTGLLGNDGVDDADVNAIVTDPNTKDRLVNYFALLDGAASVAELEQAYQEVVIRRTVRRSLDDDLNVLESPDPAVIDANLHALAQHLVTHIPADTGRSYLVLADVVATISSSGILSAEDLNDPEFDPSRFVVKMVNLDATFSDSLKLAFYTVDNPLTGNDQLVVHDASTGQQTVIKTDIILGNRAFVFDGHVEADKVIYDSRKYGIFLDPSQSKEDRTAPDGRGGVFEYTFYFDNVFKRYQITTPSNETVIYGSSMFSQALKDQGITALADEYTLFNNISDADDSYVELKAFESLPDTLRGESEGDLFHGPLLVRLGDSAVVQGHLVRVLRGADGKTAGILVSFEAIHKKDNYPAGDVNRARLQFCEADLSACSDITAVSQAGDGKFFFLGENDDHVYVAKNGTDALFAYNKSDQSLAEVGGVKYPASFNHKIHTISSAAHGSGVALRSGFSNLSGAGGQLSDGDNAYVRINYDGDASDPVGNYDFLGPIHVYKHSLILKLSGATGVTMFDNGDGIDHADESDNENVVGHANLVAVANGRLFVEIGNYEAGRGGNCTPSVPGGYNCSSVLYGYLSTISTDKKKLDVVLQPKALLRYFVSRRIAPYVLADKLYISTYVESTVPYVFTLNAYDPSDPDGGPLSTTTGRTYFTKTAQRANGIYEGTVLSWDGATGLLTNLSTNEPMGVVHGDGSVIPGDPAINSVSGLTRGVPVAGIGNLFALKADPGGHRFHLIAGEVDEETGLEYVDHVPFSSWLYE